LRGKKDGGNGGMIKGRKRGGETGEREEEEGDMDRRRKGEKGAV